MISVELAPNESWDDALLSLSLIFLPGKWWGGLALYDVTHRVAKLVHSKPENVHLYLSGRAGLYHIIKCLDLPKRSEVLVTGFTCEAVALPIIANNCIPKYIDIDDLDYSINLKRTPPLISKNARVLLIQHTFGIPPRRDELLLLAKKHNLMVIEDLAHGFQKDIFKNDLFETIKLLSFGRSKSFSAVFGGAVVTGDSALTIALDTAQKDLRRLTTKELVTILLYKPFTVLIKSLYSFLQLGKLLHKLCLHLKLLVPEISSKEKRGEYDPYFAAELPNALAILLTHQLTKYPTAYNNRQSVVKVYRDALNVKIKDDYSMIRFPVLVTRRKECLAECRKYGLILGTWYTQPVGPGGLDLASVQYERGSCPNAEFICDHIVNLPTFVSIEQAKDIAEIIKPYLLKEELPA